MLYLNVVELNLLMKMLNLLMMLIRVVGDGHTTGMYLYFHPQLREIREADH